MKETDHASLPPHLATILDLSYRPIDQWVQLPSPFLIPFPKRPRPSELKERLTPLFEAQGAGGLIPGAVRAASATWDAFAEGSVAPTDFLRAPIGAPYRVEKIAGKGRGIVASRDLKAGEIVLMESPLIFLVKDELNALVFLALPKPAIHAMMLLHNTIPESRKFSLDIDIPQHRLLDYLNGVVSTNAFGDTVDVNGTQAGLIVLTGSLFNHSSEPNVHRMFDIAASKMAFTTIAAVKEGEELTINYNQTSQFLEEHHGIRH
ncbi:hypothetical protein FB451DRAFT_1553188 [Mycena latifolia]|nr:hypothetical protein FB451DRAFT_1553188 [Mycena latifolia]